MPLQVLLIAGLLTDEDNCCMRGAFSKHGLSGPLVQIAPGAAFSGLSQIGERGFRRNKLGGGAGERSFRHDSTYHGSGSLELNREATGFHTDRRVFAGLSLSRRHRKVDGLS
jgi:hypothetical protein